jgi:ketopantoate reductase
VQREEREEAAVVDNHRVMMPHVQEQEAVLVAVKWPQMQSVLSEIGPRISFSRPLLLPQNGLVDEELRGFASYHRLVPIIVHASAVSIEHGTVIANGNAQFLMPDDAPFPSSTSLEREGFRFLSAREFRLAQILKLLIACTSAKMALRRVSIGAAFRDPHIRGELAAIVKEAASVLVTHCDGDPHLKREIDDLVQRITSGTLIDVDSMESAYTSLHYDLNVRRQETEAPWLNGFVERLARRFRIDTPLNNSLLEELAHQQPCHAVATQKLR